LGAGWTVLQAAVYALGQLIGVWLDGAGPDGGGGGGGGGDDSSFDDLSATPGSDGGGGGGDGGGGRGRDESSSEASKEMALNIGEIGLTVLQCECWSRRREMYTSLHYTDSLFLFYLLKGTPSVVFDRISCTVCAD
jgi:hypothetical protein